MENFGANFGANFGGYFVERNFVQQKGGAKVIRYRDSDSLPQS